MPPHTMMSPSTPSPCPIFRQHPGETHAEAPAVPPSNSESLVVRAGLPIPAPISGPELRRHCRARVDAGPRASDGAAAALPGRQGDA